MSLLLEHFKRVKDLHDQGIPTESTLCFDVIGTLADVYNPETEEYEKKYQALIDFKKWAHEKKLFEQHIVFSSNVDEAVRELRRKKIEPSELQLENYGDVISKKWVYNDMNLKHEELANKDNRFENTQSYKLDLIIDDIPPSDDRFIEDEVAVTHWDPCTPEVRQFLNKKEYLTLDL